LPTYSHRDLTYDGSFRVSAKRVIIVFVHRSIFAIDHPLIDPL